VSKAGIAGSADKAMVLGRRRVSAGGRLASASASASASAAFSRAASRRWDKRTSRRWDLANVRLRRRETGSAGSQWSSSTTAGTVSVFRASTAWLKATTARSALTHLSRTSALSTSKLTLRKAPNTARECASTADA